MPDVETRPGAVAYHDFGEGPASVGLPATPHSHRDFTAITSVLLRNYPVIAVDWPRCGESPPARRATGAALPSAQFDVLNTGRVPVSSAPEEFLAPAQPSLDKARPN